MSSAQSEWRDFRCVTGLVRDASPEIDYGNQREGWCGGDGLQKWKVSVSQGEGVALKSLWEIRVHLHEYRPQAGVEFTEAARRTVEVAECGGRQGTKDLGLAPDAVRTKAVDLVGIVEEGPDAEVGKGRYGTRAGRDAGSAAMVNTLVQAGRDWVWNPAPGVVAGRLASAHWNKHDWFRTRGPSGHGGRGGHLLYVIASPVEIIIIINKMAVMVVTEWAVSRIRQRPSARFHLFSSPPTSPFSLRIGQHEDRRHP
jgi:hypothetical protein